MVTIHVAPFYCITLFLPYLCYSIPIDNGVQGPPVVQCETDKISVRVSTEKPFLGRIFVKGQSKREECAKDFLNNSHPSAQMNFRLSSCGMKRERKVDKAYSIDCFYGEQNFAMVTHNVLNVSMIPTEPISANLGIQPECIYEVRKDNIDGPSAVYAEVGDKLFHRWTCAATERLRMLVKSCSVSDGNGEFFTIVDDRGCAVDPVVLTDLTYAPEQNVAFVESHAFKFADTAFLGFSCTVQVCSADKDPACENLSPPVCALDGQSYGFQTGNKRARDQPLPLLRDEVDVSAPAMNILESGLYLRQKHQTEPSSFREQKALLSNYEKPYKTLYDDKVPFYSMPNYVVPSGGKDSGEETEGDSVCVRKFLFGMLSIILFGFITVLGIVCIVLYISLRRSKPRTGSSSWIH